MLRNRKPLSRHLRGGPEFSQLIKLSQVLCFLIVSNKRAHILTDIHFLAKDVAYFIATSRSHWSGGKK